MEMQAAHQVQVKYYPPSTVENLITGKSEATPAQYAIGIPDPSLGGVLSTISAMASTTSRAILLFMRRSPVSRRRTPPRSQGAARTACP